MSLNTDNEVRNCHIVEALGLNYQKSKIYPKEHVCDVPFSEAASVFVGDNAIIYPNVEVDIPKILSGGTDPVAVNSQQERAVRARITLHGVTVTLPVIVKVTRTSVSELEVKGGFVLNVKDHDVALIPFFGLVPRDRVTLKLDLKFKASPSAGAARLGSGSQQAVSASDGSRSVLLNRSVSSKNRPKK